jgi:hypothetical protein
LRGRRSVWRICPSFRNSPKSPKSSQQRGKTETLYIDIITAM